MFFCFTLNVSPVTILSSVEHIKQTDTAESGFQYKSDINILIRKILQYSKSMF